MAVIHNSDLNFVGKINDGILSPPARRIARDGYRQDPELIQACLNGEESAWKELVDRYGRLVYSIPRHYGLSAADAEDVFQNVFSTVFRRLSSLRDQERISAWLITVAHRECQRVGRRTPNAAELDEQIEDGSTPASEKMETWERQHQVRLALSQLGEPCQDLLTALFLESDQISYDKLAERLHMPVGSIGPTRSRCFKKLQVILKTLGINDAL